MHWMEHFIFQHVLLRADTLYHEWKFYGKIAGILLVVYPNPTWNTEIQDLKYTDTEWGSSIALD